MNIRNEKSTDLTQKLTIEIVKDDYAAQVESALKKQRQKAVIPGFRPGNAPMGMVKKMYYAGILSDQLNRMIDEQIFGYLRDNDIHTLLDPIPVEDETTSDMENKEDFVFTFEYALRPEIELEWEKLPEVKKFTIKASEQEIDEYITQLRKKHGKYSNPETIDFTDDFVNVSYDNGEKRSYFHSGALNKEGQELFKDKKMNDEFEISFASVFNTPKDLAQFLKIEEKDIENENPYTYTVKIESIGRIEMAEYDEEFFQKAFPEGDVKSEKELTDIATADIEKRWAEETERFFMNDAVATLLENVKIDLPDDFIKRYVLIMQKDATPEQIDEQYPEMVKSFKWQLIESKLASENDLNVTESDIKSHIRDFFIASYFAHFNAEEVKGQLDQLVNDAMKNKEDVKRIYDMLFDKKLTAVLAEKMRLNEQSGDFDAFIASIESKENQTTKKKPAKNSAKKKDDATTEVEPVKEEKEEKKKVATTKKSTKKEE